MQQGRILKYQSGFYTVWNEGSVIVCKLRGRLKSKRQNTDIAAIGDMVEFELLSDGSGIIENILPRRNELIRMTTGIKMEYRQVLIANLDQILLVFACAHPEPHLRMLDRFLVICEKQQITPIIIANKVDLLGLDQAHTLFDPYESIGYKVIYTSALNGLDVPQVDQLIQGKVSGLVGPSGVGKSSLINRIDPSLDLRVNEISDFTDKGRHTTVVREMFPLNGGGFVADLPGLKTLALWDIEPEELDGYFPEIRDLVKNCFYSDCTHDVDEPNCAIHAAVEDGRINRERYESYLRMRFGDEEEE